MRAIVLKKLEALFLVLTAPPQKNHCQIDHQIPAISSDHPVKEAGPFQLRRP